MERNKNTESSCISQGVLVKYLKGELTGSEMNAVERHLSGCPMCSDELEGLSLLNHPEDITEITDLLNLKVDETLKQLRGSFWVSTQFRIAASVLVVVGLAGLLFYTSTLRGPSSVLSEHYNMEKQADSINEEIKPVTKQEEMPPEAKEIIEEKAVKQELVDAGSSAPKDMQIGRQVAGANSASKKMVAPPKPVLSEVIYLSDDADLFEESDASVDIKTEKLAHKLDEEEIDEEDIFIIVETMPSFKQGDITDFAKYIEVNLKYPEVAAERSIQGRVVVSFVVNALGKVTDVKIVKGVDPVIDAEAVRVISSSPDWKPGTQRGKPVSVSFTFPVTFSLK